MATYAELLKSQGATEEEIKVLVTPASEKAYAAMVKQHEDVAARATKAEAERAAVNKWYTEVAEPSAAKLIAERDQAALEASAANAKIKKAQELGLLKIMDQLEGAGDPTPTPTPTPGPDLSKYVDRDTFTNVIGAEGDAIAVAQDIAFEHQRLFPDKPLNFRELRKQALANKTSVEAQWMTNYNVQAARESRATADKTAYETKLREEGANSERAKLQTVNPNLVTPQASSNPFTGKIQSASDASQPWLKSDSERESARMNKVMGKLAVQ